MPVCCLTCTSWQLFGYLAETMAVGDGLCLQPRTGRPDESITWFGSCVGDGSAWTPSVRCACRGRPASGECQPLRLKGEAMRRAFGLLGIVLAGVCRGARVSCRYTRG